MKFFTIALMLMSPLAYCALDMKAGLWNVEMVINTNGKEINPNSEMQKALAKLTPEQRKKMQAMMGDTRIANDAGGMKVCYSKAMLEKPETIGKEEHKKCDTKVITSTSKKVVTNFTCEDGTKGDATWTVKSQTAYDGLVNVANAKGEKSKITYKANFIQSDCGKVKSAI